MDIVYHPIGVVHTPFKKIEGMPIQPSGAADMAGSIEILPEFAPGLQDIDGFSHLILLYHFHQVKSVFFKSELGANQPNQPQHVTLSDQRERRVSSLVAFHARWWRFFARSSLRMTFKKHVLKPYVPEFDHHPAERVGWLEQARGKVGAQRADDRFR